MKIMKNILYLLTEPKRFIEYINSEENTSNVSEALIVLLIANATFFTLKYPFENTFLYLPRLFGALFVSTILWFIIGFFFEFVSKIFDKSGKLKQIMICLAYSLVPVVFFCPIQLLNYVGPIGYVLSVISEGLIYLWIIYLSLKSIEITYKLTFSRAVMLIFLPLICSCFSVIWIIEFFSKTSYIFKGI